MRQVSAFPDSPAALTCRSFITLFWRTITMLTYSIRRLLILIPMLIIISFLIYAGLEIMPGDAVSYMVSPEAAAELSPERLEALRESLGLNDPFIVRYFIWLKGMVQ